MSFSFPRFIAHRGLHLHEPENTLEAFTAAYRAGFAAFECDVQLHPETHIPVIVHDDIRRQKLSKLKLPSLEDVLDFMLTHEIAMNLELKGDQAYLAHKVADVLQPYLPKLQNRILISSFEFKALLEFQAEKLPVPLARLIDVKQFKQLGFAEIAVQVQQLQAVSLHLADALLDESSIGEFLKISKRLLVYTVNDLKRAEYLFDHGISSVFTDILPKSLTAV